MIKKIDPYMTNRPKKGDIIIGEPEFNVGRTFKENIEVGVSPKDCIGEKKVVEEIWSKDKLFRIPHTYETDISCNDETRSKSCWVVIQSTLLESKKFIHCEMPESYLVIAQRMKGDQIDHQGEIIQFYTCGDKPNKIEKVFEVIANYED